MIYADEIQPDFGLLWPHYEDKDYALEDNQAVMGDWLAKRKIEELADQDPIQFGWILDSWQEVISEWRKYKCHIILGGNRSTKSKFGSRVAVDLLQKIPECRMRCYQVNGDKSIKEQQAYIWESLPEKYKALAKKKGDVHNIQYTQRGGFVDRQLILPAQDGYKRGSECLFGDFQQYRNDPQVVEGWWAHFIWVDEEIPQKMFERLLTRLIDARGRMLLTFTTIQGWTNLIADILGRTKTLRTRRSTLLKRQLPVAQESLSRTSTRIYYFWTQDNPFIPAETVDSFKGRPEAEILAIAHGIPTKSSTAKFPNFDEQIHVIPHDKLPWIAAELEGRETVRVTRYHIIDPSGSKPWAMIWAAVTLDGKVFIYRDWPDISYGALGEACENPEGRRGPAQKDNRFGITDYVEMVAACEENEEIFERLIDPRLGAASRPGQEGATSITSELEDAGMTVIPAPGLKIDHGLALINDRLRYDTTKPLSNLNAPRLYISDRCEQVIESFKNYTGASREEVFKDFVDCVRMGLEAGLDFVEAENKSDTGKTFTW